MEPRVAPPHGIPLVDDAPELLRRRTGGDGQPRLRAVPDLDGAAYARSDDFDRDDLSSVPGAIPGRRTITIRGQAAAPSARKRPGRSPYERGGARPDRIAMWAVLLGVLLILVAATSSHAAMRHRPAQHVQARSALVAARGHALTRGHAHHARVR
jgi:hypothetical protein